MKKFDLCLVEVVVLVVLFFSVSGVLGILITSILHICLNVNIFDINIFYFGLFFGSLITILTIIYKK